MDDPYSPFPVSTFPPEDPEADYEIELVVRMHGFGKHKGQVKLAESAYKALCLGLHQRDEDVEVYWEGKRVLLDTVIADGNEPPGYVPWYERVPLSEGSAKNESIIPGDRVIPDGDVQWGPCGEGDVSPCA